MQSYNSSSKHFFKLIYIVPHALLRSMSKEPYMYYNKRTRIYAEKTYWLELLVPTNKEIGIKQYCYLLFMNLNSKAKIVIIKTKINMLALIIVLICSSVLELN